MTKAKVKVPPEAMMYDKAGYYLRAAAVCVRNTGESEVLLVSSSGDPSHWVVPGGKLQLNEDARTSASREAMEEGGAKGRMGRMLGTFENSDRRHRTTVFVLYVDQLVDEFEECDRRKRRWFPVAEAVEKLRLFKPSHCKYLTALLETRDDCASSFSIPSQSPPPPTPPDPTLAALAYVSADSLINTPCVARPLEVPEK